MAQNDQNYMKRVVKFPKKILRLDVSILITVEQFFLVLHKPLHKYYLL